MSRKDKLVLLAVALITALIVTSNTTEVFAAPVSTQVSTTPLGPEESEINMTPIYMRHHRTFFQDVAHKADIHWRWGFHFGDANARHTWAQPRQAYVGYDLIGPWTPCPPLDNYNGSWFRVHEHNPATGFDWYSKKVKVPCHHSTKGATIIDLRGAPRMYYRAGRCDPRKFPTITVEWEDDDLFSPNAKGKMGPRKFYHPGYPCRF